MKSKWSLDNNSINMLLKEALLELERAGIMKDDCLRFELTLEEILLDYQKLFSKDAAVAVKLQKKSEEMY